MPYPGDFSSGCFSPTIVSVQVVPSKLPDPNCRDADHNSEQWTTVDRDRTNVREKARLKLIQGFSLYVVLMGKNYAYENKIESRWKDTLIVCTIMHSSGPADVEGMLYLSSRSKSSENPVEKLEMMMDSKSCRKGVVCSNGSQKTKSKVIIHHSSSRLFMFFFVSEYSIL